jgi:hypothetical protein
MSRFQKVGSIIAAVVATIGQAGIALAQTPVPVPSVKPVTYTGLSGIITILAKVGGWLLGLAGALAVVYLIYGGIMYITGGEKGAEKAKQMIINAITGLVIVALASLIATLVLRVIGA